MNLNEPAGCLERAHDEVHKAGLALHSICETGELSWHVHKLVMEIREDIRNVEAQIAEHVMATTESDHHA